nr:hypothetical protein [Jiangella mangrovi]
MDRRTLLAWLGGTALGAGVTGWPGLRSAAAAEAAMPAGAGAGVTVLTGATLVDGTGSGPRRATVVLAGERILAVGRGTDVPEIAGVRVVDLGGKFLVPGLWDLHTHSAEVADTFPPMHLVYGVTGIREMRGSAETHEVWRRVRRGDLDGPSMVIASKVLDGPDSRNPFSVPIVTAADARRAVHEARAEGADVVKVYSFMDRPTHAAIAREAARVGLRIAGHSPSPISVQDVVAAGQLSIEHNYGMHLSTSTRRDEYFARLEAMPDDADDPNWWGWQASQLEREAFRTYSPDHAAELGTLLAEHGAWHVPTLAVESSISIHPSKHLDDPERVALMERFMPRALREEWLAWIEAWPAWTPEREALELEYFDAKLRLAGDLAAAGRERRRGHRLRHPVRLPRPGRARRAGAAGAGRTVADARPAGRHPRRGALCRARGRGRHRHRGPARRSARARRRPAGRHPQHPAHPRRRRAWPVPGSRPAAADLRPAGAGRPGGLTVSRGRTRCPRGRS